MMVSSFGPYDCGTPIYRRREALSMWKSRLGSQATYRTLMEVFIKAGRPDYAKTIVEILKGADMISQSPAGHSVDSGKTHI